MPLRASLGSLLVTWGGSAHMPLAGRYPAKSRANLRPARTRGSRCIRVGCPAWMKGPFRLRCSYEQRSWFGSNVGGFMLQEFETCPVWGAKLSDNELSALLVNGATARTCWKWPILREGPLSCSAIRPVPAPRFGSLAPFPGAFLSVSDNQCTFG